MKTAGIIGGIGPESTIEYYRLLMTTYREQNPDGSAPSVIINSINLHKMLGLIERNQLEEVTAYLVSEVRRLAAAGAHYGLLAANTPHIVFDEIRRQSPIPLVSIVGATCEFTKARGFKRVGLFGTRFTMQGRFYADVFSKEGITVIAPDPNEQAFIHHAYLTELLIGVFLPETSQRLHGIVERLKKEQAIEAVILGGTELPLLLREPTAEGIPLLDTTRIHVKALIAALLS